MSAIFAYSDRESIREQVIQTVKKFKSSWVELGQILYSVWKNKLYKDWGYQNFDTYVTREVHIRKNTALKLLRSYYFLEKEEPGYLRKDADGRSGPVPSYETVDLLRRAKDKQLPPDDYARLRQKVFVDNKEPTEVRRDLTTLIKQREELEPQEAWDKRRVALMKRFVTTLKSLERQAMETKMISSDLLNDIRKLTKRIEDEI